MQVGNTAGRIAALLLLAITALLGSTLVVAGQAVAADELQIRGTLTGAEGEPVEGAEVRVTDEEGFEGEGTSDSDGNWAVDLPGPGSYSVTLIQESLPEGVGLTDPERDTLTISVFSNSKTVQFPIGEAVDNGNQTLNRAVQLFVDGLAFGLIIALSGVGLSLIFGTTGLTNFAHGDLMTIGAFTTLIFNNIIGLPFLVAASLSLMVAAVVGWGQDRGLWRPLRRRGTGLIALLVVSIGLGIFIRYSILFFFGGSTTQYAEYSGQAGLVFGPIIITPKALIASGIAILALGATIAWLLLSRMGKASRAISDNPALASASGIDVEQVISRVWIIGTMLAALGGIVYSLSNGVNWLQGFQILLLVFAGVVVGGLGTAFGALVGSLAVGVLIQMSTLIIPPELKNLGALVVLIIILLIRPQGILGRAERIG